MIIRFFVFEPIYLNCVSYVYTILCAFFVFLHNRVKLLCLFKSISIKWERGSMINANFCNYIVILVQRKIKIKIIDNYKNCLSFVIVIKYFFFVSHALVDWS